MQWSPYVFRKSLEDVPRPSIVHLKKKKETSETTQRCEKRFLTGDSSANRWPALAHGRVRKNRDPTLCG
jgi:hypothetical protein